MATDIPVVVASIVALSSNVVIAAVEASRRRAVDAIELTLLEEAWVAERDLVADAA
jgi:hypothetical protein